MTSFFQYHAEGGGCNAYCAGDVHALVLFTDDPEVEFVPDRDEWYFEEQVRTVGVRLAPEVPVPDGFSAAHRAVLFLLEVTP